MIKTESNLSTCIKIMQEHFVAVHYLGHQELA
jgi:hypothetical protein